MRATTSAAATARPATPSSIRMRCPATSSSPTAPSTGTPTPDTYWWKYGSTKQEGAAMPPAQEATIIQNLATLLPASSPKTSIAAMDGYNIDHTVSIFNGYSAATKAAMTEVNTHTYEGSQR